MQRTLDQVPQVCCVALGYLVALSELGSHCCVSFVPQANAQIPTQPHWTPGDHHAHGTAEEMGFRLSKEPKTSQLVRIRPGFECRSL